MEDIFKSPEFSIAFTFCVYHLARLLHKRFGYFFLNPILVSIAVIIAFLHARGISYEEYSQGGNIISFFLGPAVVALGVPLYLQLPTIKKEAKAILVSTFAGSISGVIAVMIIGKLFGASSEVILSMLPKAVTTPIAMGIAENIGGVPSMTAVFVMLAGLTGSIFGIGFLKLTKVKHSKAMGLAMGAASHGLGTAAVSELGKEHSAYGGLALGICGVITAVVTPLLLELVLMFVEI
ncbi:LrgB family protein [Aureibacter tunicatorum]|uniref:Murein hydrolase (TIGR00659 family) n=1 Tax=Aureibacter tunicatorum TaxID=866807 RepID=A0AAE3XGF4_9BACT|nr:LrgB family protein [Aureibacter tunicatorum]MDR6237141.1 putative murein hydrolase (TIGR00659 family) [Aureibacter tunicatorum]BDD06133.1 membrane protein [Aureibacter tunicatorum]